MKKALKKILVIVLIILTLNNFLISSVYADDDDGIGGGVIGDIIQGHLESVVGLLTYPIRIIALAAATAINALTASVAYIEGSTDPSFDMGASESLGNVFSKSISPFDIFFNKVKILDVNFFDIETTGPEAESIVNKIRLGIATWYYVLRIIALAILLVVLVYVGIRMAITTIAADKAMYKKMLLDWITSIVLIFLIPYIITFTLIVSNSVINAISLGVDSEEITKTYTTIGEVAYRLFDVDSVAATIVYCMLVWQTLGILLSYFNRMLKVAFLVIISPLITLTYSIDKMGDGKAQALGNWLKEFVFTILIQPFHCIIYMCFINVAFNLLISDPEGNKNTMAVAVISILCVRFVKEAEKIVRKIFNFQDDGEASLGAGLAMATMALSQSKNIGRSARSMVNNVRNIGSATASGIRGIGRGISAVGSGASKMVGSATLNAMALGATMKNGNSFSENKNKVTEERAERIEKKYDPESNGKIEESAGEIKNSATNILKGTASSKARLENARAMRKNYKKNKKSIKNTTKQTDSKKKIKKSRGFVNSVKSIYQESEVIQGAKSAAKFYTSAGLGLMGASGIYGAGGNLSTSIATGGAIFATTNEFMKNTSKTLALSADKNLHALGATSKEDAINKINDIMEKFSDNDDVESELKSIMKEIKKALTASGVDEKHATSIQNRIQRGIKADPSNAQNIIKYALTSTGANGRDGKNLYETNGGAVRHAAEKLADFTNESQIYENVQAAGDMGITADTFVAQVVGSYSVTERERENYVKNNNERKEYEEQSKKTELVEKTATKYESVDKYKENAEELDYEISSMNMEDLSKLEETFEDKIRELQIEGRDDLAKQVEREKVELIAKALANMESNKDEIVSRMKKEYEKQLEYELKNLQSDIAQINQSSTYKDVLKEREARMQQTLDLFKSK